MPRYIVERTFPERTRDPDRQRRRRDLPDRRAAKRRVGCHVGPLLRERGQEDDLLRLRRADPGRDPRDAAANELPVDRITQVQRARPLLLQLTSNGGSAMRATSSSSEPQGMSAKRQTEPRLSECSRRVSISHPRRLLAVCLLVVGATLTGVTPTLAIPPRVLASVERRISVAHRTKVLPRKLTKVSALTGVAAAPSFGSLGSSGNGPTLVNDPGLDHIQSFPGEEPSVYVTQSETSVASFGNDVLVGYNSSAGARLSDPEDYSQILFSGYSVSHDRGHTWQSGFVPAPPGEAEPVTLGDPTVGVDRAGTFYYLTINGPGLQINKSSDRGRTWSAGHTIVEDLFSDKPWLAIGRDPVVSSRDDIYVTWSRLTEDGCQLWLARSTDGGATWTEKLLYAPTATADMSACAQFANPTVDSTTGRLYIPFLQFGTEDTDYIKVLVSDDGGNTFSFRRFNVPGAPEATAFPNVSPGSLEDCGWGGEQLALHQGPATTNPSGLPSWAQSTRLITQPSAAAVNGRLYMAINSSTSAEYGAGIGSTIRLLYSPDGGLTWAPPTTVAASTQSTPQHVLPAITVSRSGSQVSVVYYVQEASGMLHVSATSGDLTGNGVHFHGATRTHPSLQPGTHQRRGRGHHQGELRLPCRPLLWPGRVPRRI